MKVLVVGNTGLDILYQVPRLPQSHEKLQASSTTVAGGGAPANVAHWLAKLGHTVDFATVTGTDPLSASAIQYLADAGIGISNVQRVPEVGPSVTTIASSGAQKSMICGRSGAGPDHWATLVGGTDFSGFDHVHFAPDLYPILFATGVRSRLEGGSTSIDLNGRYSAGMLRDIDICFSNHDELMQATDNVSPDALLARDLTGASYHFVVTKGADSVICYRPGERTRLKPEPVQMVDRTGGGDAFCAGYLHAYWAQGGIEKALDGGLTMARAAFSGIGARPETEAADQVVRSLVVRYGVGDKLDRNGGPHPREADV